MQCPSYGKSTYDFFNKSGSATGSLSGRDVGMKYSCYDDGHVVTNECWLDVSNNTWVKKYTFVDNGKGSGGGNCKSSSDSQVDLWGGPELTSRSDGLTYDCRKISGREINPTGTLTDDAQPVRWGKWRYYPTKYIAERNMR
jgi:hypothetical protein